MMSSSGPEPEPENGSGMRVSMKYTKCDYEELAEDPNGLQVRILPSSAVLRKPATALAAHTWTY